MWVSKAAGRDGVGCSVRSPNNRFSQVEVILHFEEYLIARFGSIFVFDFYPIFVFYPKQHETPICLFFIIFKNYLMPSEKYWSWPIFRRPIYLNEIGIRFSTFVQLQVLLGIALSFELLYTKNVIFSASFYLMDEQFNLFRMGGGGG